MDLYRLSLKELRDKLAQGEVSPLEVCDHYIDRIEKYNPKLNAVCEGNFETARAQAKSLTSKSSRTDKSKKPLWGVPYTLKEMIAYTGKKRTGGNVHFRDHVSQFTGTVPTRLEQAGAILLATSNVPEMGFWFECFNKIYGTTNNPYDLQRTPGGSTGGEAALIGAGLSPLGVGSDIGGSLRLPAFFCGIAAHAPSRGLTPLSGHFPHGEKDLLSYVQGKRPLAVVGPMTKRASDLEDVLALMAGPDDLDPACTLNYRASKKEFSPKDLKVFVLSDPKIHMTSRATPELQQEVESVAKLLGSYGAQVEEFPSQLLKNAVPLWMELLSSTKNHSFSQTLMQQVEGNARNLRSAILKNLALLPLKKNQYTLPSLSTALLETFSGESPAENPHLKELQRLKAKMRSLLGENGVLLMPTHPRPAPKHFRSLFYPFDFIYTGIMISLELPVTQLPTRLNSENLPLGVQIVANFDRDALALETASFLEQFFEPLWPKGFE